jgi:hypothetical protein
LAAAPKRDDRYSWCLQETAIVSVSRTYLLCPQNAAACVSLSKSTMSKTRPGCPCPPFSARCRRGAAYLVAPEFRVNRLLSKRSGFRGSRRSGLNRTGGSGVFKRSHPIKSTSSFRREPIFSNPSDRKLSEPSRRWLLYLEAVAQVNWFYLKTEPIFLVCRAENLSVPAVSGASSRSAIPPSTDHFHFPLTLGRSRLSGANGVKGRRGATLFSILHRVE